MDHGQKLLTKHRVRDKKNIEVDDIRSIVQIVKNVKGNAVSRSTKAEEHNGRQLEGNEHKVQRDESDGELDVSHELLVILTLLARFVRGHASARVKHGHNQEGRAEEHQDKW